MGCIGHARVCECVCARAHTTGKKKKKNLEEKVQGEQLASPGTGETSLKMSCCSLESVGSSLMKLGR